MNIAQLCTEQEVSQLVHAFYDRVRNDPLIGPVFTEHVSDWPSHLEKMVDFWSSTLRGTARFRGSPMVTHNRLTGISETHFQRWLELFRQTTQDMDNPALQARANDLSVRIAQSLWYGYQMNRQADVLPSTLLHHPQGA
jgi:hemoglobin